MNLIMPQKKSRGTLCLRTRAATFSIERQLPP